MREHVEFITWPRVSKLNLASFCRKTAANGIVRSDACFITGETAVLGVCLQHTITIYLQSECKMNKATTYYFNEQNGQLIIHISAFLLYFCTVPTGIFTTREHQCSIQVVQLFSAANKTRMLFLRFLSIYNSRLHNGRSLASTATSTKPTTKCHK
jgi:hypothetical protein